MVHRFFSYIHKNKLNWTRNCHAPAMAKVLQQVMCWCVWAIEYFVTNYKIQIKWWCSYCHMTQMLHNPGMLMMPSVIGTLYLAMACPTKHNRTSSKTQVKFWRRHQQNDKKLAAFLGFSDCRQAHKCAVFPKCQDSEALWGPQLEAWLTNKFKAIIR
jgi:hypothetical protein